MSLGLAVSGGGAGSAAAYVLVELLAGFLAATAFSVTHQAGCGSGRERTDED